MITGKKIAVIGEGDYLLAFKATGCEVIKVSSDEEAKAVLHPLLADDKYSIIFITESLAEKNEDFLRAADFKTLPSVILIPDHRGSKGLAHERMREIVKKAIGADIYIEKEKTNKLEEFDEGRENN